MILCFLLQIFDTGLLLLPKIASEFTTKEKFYKKIELEIILRFA